MADRIDLEPLKEPVEPLVPIASRGAAVDADQGPGAAGRFTADSATEVPEPDKPEIGTSPARPAEPVRFYDDAPSKKKKLPGWVVPLIVIGVFLALIGAAAAACSSLLSGPSASYAPNTVAVITMDGTIGYDGSANSPEGLKELLDDAAAEDNIKALVLRVNSGGGTAAAGEEMALYLAECEKPVVVSSASINASAAYMVSSQADYIYVLKSTDIGAIGTIMQHYDLSELYEKLGINIENIKSADSKDSSYSNRPLTDEERKRYQRLIDSINQVFIELVAEGRSMPVDEVSALADGMTWVGTEAVELGLADEVGTFDDACAKAAELAGLGDDYDVTDIGIYNSSITDYLWLISGKEQSTEEKLLEALEEILEHDGTVH